MPPISPIKWLWVADDSQSMTIKASQSVTVTVGLVTEIYPSENIKTL